MHNIVLVAVSQRAENLFHNSGAIALSESFALGKFVKQLAAFAILGDYHKAFAVVEDFKHFEDIWMIHGLKQVYLEQELLECLLSHSFFVHYLDGSFLLRCDMKAGSDFGVSTSANDVTDLVMILD